MRRQNCTSGLDSDFGANTGGVRMPPMNLLIKPASGLCNVQCDYCFYRDVAHNRVQNQYGLMSTETIEQVMKQTFAFAEQDCTIAYQGGEPTLAGLPFFRKAMELQKKYNIRRIPVHNAIQTNGVGLSDEWAVFLKEHGFLVGLSLDGRKKTHDCYRKTADGGGTFHQVLKAVEILRKHQVEFNILTVVHAKTAKEIHSIYAFYKQQGFDYLQFIPCLQPFGKEKEVYPYTLTAKMYGEILITLFDLWYQDWKNGRRIHILQFENYIQMLLGLPPESCGMCGICSVQNVIESDGSVYPCDFYVLDEHRLGTVWKNTFSEMYHMRDELAFIQPSRQIHRECAGCEYFYLCRGGCRRQREPMVDGMLQKNVLCEGYRQFFYHAIPKLQSLASDYLKRNG